MRKTALLAACSFAFVAAVLSAQTPAPAQAPAATPPPLPEEIKNMYTTVAGYISKTAGMLSEDKYKYQATPDVRSFARLFAHITDDNNGACAVLAGEAAIPRVDTGTAGNWAADKMTKADLDKGLNDSIARCQKAFANVTVANMLESGGGRGTRSKIGLLMYNTSHINEHYGNLVTYLRLNGLVPPSSAPR